jgi:hypothetical protein
MLPIFITLIILAIIANATINAFIEYNIMDKKTIFIIFAVSLMLSIIMGIINAIVHPHSPKKPNSEKEKTYKPNSSSKNNTEGDSADNANKKPSEESNKTEEQEVVNKYKTII